MKNPIKKIKGTIVTILAILLVGMLLGGCGAGGEASDGASAAYDSAGEDDAAEADQAEASEDASGESDIILSLDGAIASGSREETVNVKASETGEPQSIKVEETISVPQNGDVVLDVTNLADIKNKKGDEEYNLLPDGTLLWQNHGEDITYEGTYDGTLPVGVKLTYFLDNREVSASEIAGKSGDIRIRFDYTNSTSAAVTVGEGDDAEEITTIVPMTAVTAVVLSEDYFSDIEVENGKLLSLDGEQIAIGYALPGLYDALRLADYEDLADTEIPEYVEITAHTTEFALDYTATIFTNGIFADIEDEDLDDMSELADDFSELGEASDDISDALVSLRDGSSELGTYLTQYVAGVNALYEGILAAEAGISDPAAKAALSALSESAAQLAAAGVQLETGYGGLSSGLRKLAGGYLEFDEDGIQELSGKGGGDISDILTRVRALRENDRGYEGLTGNTDGTDVSVRFVIETAEVK